MPSGNIPDRGQKKILAIKEDSRDPNFIIENINIIMKHGKYEQQHERSEGKLTVNH